VRDLRHDAADYARWRVRVLRSAVGAEFADLNRGIAHVLRGGVLLSVGVLLAGLVIAAIEGSGFPSQVLEPGQLLGPLVRFRPQALLSLGVLILVLTPVVRVALSLVGFLKERDGTYVAITAIVLLNLAAAFLIGIL
jgi:uncharacterized membrane protein